MVILSSVTALHRISETCSRTSSIVRLVRRGSKKRNPDVPTQRSSEDHEVLKVSGQGSTELASLADEAYNGARSLTNASAECERCRVRVGRNENVCEPELRRDARTRIQFS